MVCVAYRCFQLLANPTMNKNVRIRAKHRRKKRKLASLIDARRTRIFKAGLTYPQLKWEDIELGIKIRGFEYSIDFQPDSHFTHQNRISESGNINVGSK